MEVVEIDGSMGEGGGQILRTAAAFSAIKGVPIRVRNIRAGRREPGLRRQHLSALRVLRQIFDGDLQGDFEGSSEISFTPGRRALEKVEVDMKTAASIPLVLQAVVPAVSVSGSRLSLTLLGGTDVPWSPTFDYLVEVAANAFKLMGIDFAARSARRGYYPKGGGRVTAEMLPCKAVSALDLSVSQPPHTAAVFSRCALLPRHVAERQAEMARKVLEGRGIVVEDETLSVEPADSPGSSIMVRTGAPGSTLGADGLGSRGRPAESVGADAAGKFADAALAGASLDSNLADMVAPILSLAPGESRLRIPQVTKHLETSLLIAKVFTGCEYSFAKDGGTQVVIIRPR